MISLSPLVLVAVGIKSVQCLMLITQSLDGKPTGCKCIFSCTIRALCIIIVHGCLPVMDHHRGSQGMLTGHCSLSWSLVLFCFAASVVSLLEPPATQLPVNSPVKSLESSLLPPLACVDQAVVVNLKM